MRQQTTVHTTAGLRCGRRCHRGPYTTTGLDGVVTGGRRAPPPDSGRSGPYDRWTYYPGYRVPRYPHRRVHLFTGLTPRFLLWWANGRVLGSNGSCCGGLG